MDKFRIEKMTLSSLDEVMVIEELAYGQHHWSRDSFAAEIDNQISDYNCAVAQSGQIAGYMGLWKIIDEGHVTNLAIHPDFRRKGAAKVLLLNALDECYREKIKYLTLEVRVSNLGAIKLYESFGFKSLGLRKKYYQNNNEDALIMWSENIFSENYKKRYAEIKEKIGNLILK
ncbi:TPA: ribosomal protein S18-alanine N-acetyltransferase [Candidatus Galligastranaerophilus faecipullorum]|nr:ribosomal protein S18-alanine N-acetyltransferase [Candidatus Galligastranaerophilus faecipullorum]